MSTPDPQITGCTVASPAYRAHAIVLAESFLAHHPDGRFAIADLGAVAPDGRPGEGLRAGDERIEVIAPATLAGSPEELARLGLAYSTQGLAGAMKPRLLSHLRSRGDEVVILIDSDIDVLGSLAPVAERARGAGTLVTPHMTRPLLEAEYPTVLAGAFNTGFAAVAAGSEALLEWWTERTRRECVFRPHRGLVWEQSWLGIAPAFFGVEVLRDTGVNAMTRELLDGADVEWGGEGPTLAGRPLLCFHFSGPYDPREPDFLLSIAPSGADVVRRGSRYGPGELHWLSLERRPGAARMSRDYADRLLAAGFDEMHGAPAPFTELPGSPGVHRAMRDAYRSALIEHERGEQPEPPNPFAGASAERFVDWLAEPVVGPDGDGDAVSRFLLGLWNVNGGGAFTEVPGRDSAAFVSWAAERLLPPAGAVPPRLDPRIGDPRQSAALGARIGRASRVGSLAARIRRGR